MDALLGLVVLTSPLFLIIAWLPISIWLTRKLVKWIGFKNGAVRLMAGMFGFVLVFMLPFADEIAGQVYFNHLCGTEAGVKIYQTVELPAEYWDGQGKPKFYDERNGNLRLPIDSIKWESRTKSYPLGLEKNISEMKTIQRGQHRI